MIKKKKVFNNIDLFLRYLEKKEYNNNFIKSKKIKNIYLNLSNNMLKFISNQNIFKYFFNKKSIENQIKEINKIYNCINYDKINIT